MATVPALRRAWLVRLLDRVNYSRLPFCLVPQRRVEGCLARWELWVLTARRPVALRGATNSGRRVPLGFWREQPSVWLVPRSERHPGADVLPFRHERRAA